jgi:hypothetical protein
MLTRFFYYSFIASLFYCGSVKAQCANGQCGISRSFARPSYSYSQPVQSFATPIYTRVYNAPAVERVVATYPVQPVVRSQYTSNVGCGCGCGCPGCACSGSKNLSVHQEVSTNSGLLGNNVTVFNWAEISPF